MNPHESIRPHERTRRDRQIEDFVHDPYRASYKPQEPSVCPDCGVVFEKGAWHWKPRPEEESMFAPHAIARVIACRLDT